LTAPPQNAPPPPGNSYQHQSPPAFANVNPSKAVCPSMPASIVSQHHESDFHAKGDPSRFTPVGKCSNWCRASTRAL
jgi:hypothetical protein